MLPIADNLHPMGRSPITHIAAFLRHRHHFHFNHIVYFLQVPRNACGKIIHPGTLLPNAYRHDTRVLQRLPSDLETNPYNLHFSPTGTANQFRNHLRLSPSED